MVEVQHFDAVVIGAGPTGSTAATVLAQRGRRVVVLEREQFPRYKVGESLLPYCYFPLERIGMIEKLKASRFVKKYSVQFASTDGRISSPFYFFQHFDHEAAQTWQVIRSEFDQMMLDHAVEAGAHVQIPMGAKELIKDDEGVVLGVRAEDASGQAIEFRAPMTIDATGRDAFAANRQNWRVADEKLKKIAIWTYYRGAKRDEGLDEGATTVAYVPEKGWFWYIPLPDDVVSVGIVAEKDYLYRDGKGLEAIFAREVKNNPWIESHLAQGTQFGPYRVTGDYSYRSKYCATDGLILAGDSFGFLDPVFSSGVFLGLMSGELAGIAVDEALRDNDFSGHRFKEYGEKFIDGIEAMRQLVYAFYDEAFSFGAVLKKYPNLRGDMTDCLIGNVEKDFKPLFKAVSEFAKIPDRLSHGLPTAVKAGDGGKF